MFNNQTTAPTTKNSSEVLNEKLEMLNALFIDDLTDYKLRNLKGILTDELDNLHDTINNEIEDERLRNILFDKSNRIMTLFKILEDILPQIPDYFERVNMICRKYEDLLTLKKVA